MYKDFIHIFVLSCTKATYLTEKRLHGKLTLLETLQLQIHLSLCKRCTDYNKKAQLLDLLAKKEVIEIDSNRVYTRKELADFKKKVYRKIKKNRQ